MQFEFEGRCVLQMEHTPGMGKPKHIATKVNLDLSSNLDRSGYLKEDLPNAAGSKALTNIFVQGLIANIHHAHQKGYWNDAEHLRYIIAELENGFASVVEVGTSTF